MPVPPNAASDVEYATPNVPFGSELVEIDKVAFAGTKLSIEPVVVPRELVAEILK